MKLFVKMSLMAWELVLRAMHAILFFIRRKETPSMSKIPGNKKERVISLFYGKGFSCIPFICPAFLRGVM